MRDFIISRLRDGRLCWLKSTGAFVLVDGTWVVDPELTFGDVTESKPLSDSAIAELVAAGIVSR